MKYLDFLNENIGEKITLYHTSGTKKLTLKDNPMWFTDNISCAEAYHEDRIMNDFKSYTYKCVFQGIIIPNKEIHDYFKDTKHDYEDLETDLIENPSNTERKKIVKILKQHLPECDAIYQQDYDPRNPQKMIETIFVFNPMLRIKNIELISF